MKPCLIQNLSFRLYSMARIPSHDRLCFIALFFGSLLHVASAQSIQLKPCYGWDGSSSNNFPCNPEANVSACCGGGSMCMTNIYCKNPSGLLVVGACTDRSWNDPACPWRLSGFSLHSSMDSAHHVRRCPSASHGGPHLLIQGKHHDV